jgi:uncharacterized protein (DUF2062 family)
MAALLHGIVEQQRLAVGQKAMLQPLPIHQVVQVVLAILLAVQAVLVLLALLL